MQSSRRGLAVALGGLLFTAACATPTAHHVGDSAGGLYFNTPWSWTSVDAASLKKAEAGWSDSPAGTYLLDSIVWQGVWGSATQISPADAFGNNPPPQPIVIGMVRKLYQQEQSALQADVSNALADLVLPVSSANAGDGLEVLQQQQVKLGKLPGLRQVLSWDTNGQTQTLTSIAVVNQARTRLYWLVGRCADPCPAGQQQELAGVLDSMTVKEPKVG